MAWKKVRGSSLLWLLAPEPPRTNLVTSFFRLKSAHILGQWGIILALVSPWEGGHLRKRIRNDFAKPLLWCELGAGHAHALRFSEGPSPRDDGSPRNGQQQQQHQQKLDPEQEFLVNSGTVIRTLRAELPVMFEEELSYGIYAPNIVFYEETVAHIGVSGLAQYRRLIKTLTYVAGLYYRRPHLEPLGFTQRARGVIAVRWTFTGEPRKLLPTSSTERAIYDGVFVYKLNEQGWVREHILETILPAPPAILGNNIRELFGVRLAPEPLVSVSTATAAATAFGGNHHSKTLGIVKPRD